jgi:hypothetical protein
MTNLLLLFLVFAIALVAFPSDVQAAPDDAPDDTWGKCVWKTKPRLRCECGSENPYSPWDKCVLRKR